MPDFIYCTLKKSSTAFVNLGLLILFFFVTITAQAKEEAWIRINQLGYAPAQKKVAVLVSKKPIKTAEFVVKESKTDKAVFKADLSKDFGQYGPFSHGFRLDFSDLDKEGSYYVQVGAIKS